jgi:threonine synthase
VVSTGNAGASLATYAHRGEVKSVVFCYHRGDPIKMSQMSLMASQFCIFEGEYDDLIRSVDQCVEEGLAFDGGATRNPFKHEGKKTIAYEVVETLGRVPDFFFAPVAVGEIFISTYRGFTELQRLEIAQRAPILVCCQSDQACPVVQAFTGGPFKPTTVGPTMPGRGGWRSRSKGARFSGSCERPGVVAVSDTEVQKVSFSERVRGLWAGPTGVVSLAGLIQACRKKKIDPDSSSSVSLAKQA